MVKSVKIILIILVAMFFTSQVKCQCKDFTKKECKPLLSPYIYNGQLNTAILSEGDYAELLITFYSNQNYRIVVCSDKQLGKVEFKLLDLNGNEVFSNTEHDFINNWDFTTNTTQQLRVEVSVPKTNNKEEKTGCVSILVGFKDKK